MSQVRGAVYKNKGVLFTLFMVAVLMGWAAAPASSSPGLEIKGLLLDETQTHVGRQFYEYFSSLWVEPRGVSDYTVKVGERASAKWGDWVWVLVTVGPYRDRMVFRSAIKPNTTDVKERALDAVRRTLGFIEWYKKLKGNIKEEDLKGDGF